MMHILALEHASRVLSLTSCSYATNSLRLELSESGRPVPGGFSLRIMSDIACPCDVSASSAQCSELYRSTLAKNRHRPRSPSRSRPALAH